MKLACLCNATAAAAATFLIIIACGDSVCRADIQLTVNQAGGAQFTSVQSAIDSIPANPSQRYVINIAPGTYTEQVRVNKPDVTLRGTGANASATVLTFNQAAQPGNSLDNASTAIQSADFVGENLSFQNTAGQNAGQALAMYVKADRAVFDNCRFLGWQDTLRSEAVRNYFQDCYMEGSVDFVYGKGQSYFEDCTLYAKVSGVIAAQGRETDAETNGFIFHNATITGSAPNGSVYLGRPWQPSSRAIYIDSNLGSVINSAGWEPFSGNTNDQTCYFAEYDDIGPGAAGTRVAWAHQLTSQQVTAYSLTNWLSGSDHWNPLALVPEPGMALVLISGLSIFTLRRQRRLTP